MDTNFHDLDKICTALASVRCDLNSEPQTHESITKALTEAGVSFKREVRQSPQDRFDFICEGGIVIEVKLDGAKRDIFRQVSRYATHDAVNAVVLATARACRLPSLINNKPARVVSLSRAWL